MSRVSRSGLPLWVPNLLTLSRILFTAPIAALLLMGGEGARWAAFGLYFAVGWSDFFDGWLARRHGLVSAWGRVLDPIADKIQVSIIAVVLTAHGPLGHPLLLVPLVLVLSREIAVSGLREGLAAAGPQGAPLVVPVSRLAKAKTVLQLHAVWLSIPFAAWPGGVMGAGLVVLWVVTAALTLWTAAGYVRLALRP